MKIRITDGDGNKVVRIKFRDELGNESAEFTDSVVLDNISPKGAILINNGEDATGGVLVNLKLSATDQNGVVAYQLSNDGQTWSSEFIYTQTQEVSNWDLRLFGGNVNNGLRSVYARYKDTPGNWSDPVSDDINVDASAPSISIQLIGNDREALKPVVVTAIIRDNNKVTDAFLYYRKKGSSEYIKVPMVKLTGRLLHRRNTGTTGNSGRN